MDTSNTANYLLTYVKVVKVMEKQRSSSDQRVRVTKTIVEYRNSLNEEYRGIFETKKGTEPNIPRSVMSFKLPAYRKQW